MQIDWQFVFEVLKAFLTPLIAVIAAYIAWQQWKTNELKIKLDRYDRRLQIYKEVKKLLSIISINAKVSMDDLVKFSAETSEADFLFGPEIPKFIDAIYSSGLTLWQRNSEYSTAKDARAEDYDHLAVVTDMNKQLKWLVSQFIPARDIFKPYLDISK